MRILVQLGVANPVPALNTPSVTNQLLQRFWGGAQAGEEQVLRLKGLAIAAAGGRHLHDLAADVTPFIGPVLMRVGGCGHAAAPG